MSVHSVLYVAASVFCLNAAWWAYKRGRVMEEFKVVAVVCLVIAFMLYGAA